MYLVALPRSLHFFAFILHLTAVFFHVISESHYLLKLSRLNQRVFLKSPLTYFLETKKREKIYIYTCISYFFFWKIYFIFFFFFLCGTCATNFFYRCSHYVFPVVYVISDCTAYSSRIITNFSLSTFFSPLVTSYFH